MGLARSAFKRTLKLASLASGLWKEEMVRRLVGTELNASRIKQAKLLVEELGKLKGAAMKLGQTLAIESRDFFPEEVVAILEKLQNQTSFMPYEEVDRILQQELGTKRELITSISKEPIAAASIGQVHLARFRNEQIVIKIQYPGIQDTIKSDVKILRKIVELSSSLFYKSQVEFGGVFEELQEVFEQEASYLKEAEATMRYREMVSQFPDVSVPEVYAEVSTDKVLALSYHPGQTLSEALKNGSLTEEKRKWLGKLFLELYTHEFCENGYVQTDPNLGNFLIDTEKQKLILLDFGAVREFSDEFRKRYGELVFAGLTEDRAKCLSIGHQMGLIDPREKEPAQNGFYSLMSKSMRPFREASFHFGESDYADQMRQISRDLIRHLEYSPPPRALIFLHRKLGGIFQILRRLNLELDLRPYLEAYRKCSRKSRFSNRIDKTSQNLFSR